MDIELLIWLIVGCFVAAAVSAKLGAVHRARVHRNRRYTGRAYDPQRERA